MHCRLTVLPARVHVRSMQTGSIYMNGVKLPVSKVQYSLAQRAEDVVRVDQASGAHRDVTVECVFSLDKGRWRLLLYDQVDVSVRAWRIIRSTLAPRGVTSRSPRVRKRRMSRLRRILRNRIRRGQGVEVARRAEWLLQMIVFR